jgi:hypothetical protein
MGGFFGTKNGSQSWLESDESVTELEKVGGQNLKKNYITPYSKPSSSRMA